MKKKIKIVNADPNKKRGKSSFSGMDKFGAVLGDYVELGCNTVTCPGVLMGKNSWVYPNTTLQKGFYKTNTFFGSTKKNSLATNKK